MRKSLRRRKPARPTGGTPQRQVRRCGGGRRKPARPTGGTLPRHTGPDRGCRVRSDCQKTQQIATAARLTALAVLFARLRHTLRQKSLGLCSGRSSFAGCTDVGLLVSHPVCGSLSPAARRPLPHTSLWRQNLTKSFDLCTCLGISSLEAHFSQLERPTIFRRSGALYFPCRAGARKAGGAAVLRGARRLFGECGLQSVHHNQRSWYPTSGKPPLAAVRIVSGQ